MRLIPTVFSTLFILSGGLVIVIDAESASGIRWIAAATKYKSLVFGIHMAGWMILGMLANYYWDLLNAGKKFSDTNLNELLLPILVSPIVFYVVWSLWGGEHGVIAFSWNLVAFQNGFFWQVVLSKAAPFGAGEATNKQRQSDA